MVNAVPFDFRLRFDEGVKCYLAGKWSDAKLQYFFTYLALLMQRKFEAAMDQQKNC